MCKSEHHPIKVSPPSFSPHQCFGVGVGLLVHDDLCHLVMPAVGGHVQRRQVVVGNVVHGRVVVQQQLDAVEVVTLRRHVEGRQTVLRGRQEEDVFVRTDEKSETETERQFRETLSSENP